MRGATRRSSTRATRSQTSRTSPARTSRTTRPPPPASASRCVRERQPRPSPLPRLSRRPPLSQYASLSDANVAHPADIDTLLRDVQRQYGQAVPPPATEDANVDPRIAARGSRISAYVHYVRVGVWGECTDPRASVYLPILCVLAGQARRGDAEGACTAARDRAAQGVAAAQPAARDAGPPQAPLVDRQAGRRPAEVSRAPPPLASLPRRLHAHPLPISQPRWVDVRHGLRRR